MKSIFFAVLSACLIFDSDWASAQSVEAVQPPVIELVGTNSVDLGLIPNYKYQLVRFVFRNPGNSPVEIRRVQSTCPCIRGYPQTAVLQPKGEVTITVELNATVVSGQFVRKVFVETNDKQNPQIGLSVLGEVQPLFAGFPVQPLVFRVPDAHETETNHFTVTATETNLFFAASTVFCSNTVLQATAYISTNLTEKTNASYDVTLVVASHHVGRQAAILEFPTQGQGRTNLPPFRLTIQGRIGTELGLSPSEVLIADPGAGNVLVRHLRVRVGEGTVDTKALTWSPQREGVSFSVKEAPKPKFNRSIKSVNPPKSAFASKGLGAKNPVSAEKDASSLFLVTMTLTQKAAAQILSEKDPTLTFTYPKFKPTVLHLVSKPSDVKADDAEEKEPEAPAEEN